MFKLDDMSIYLIKGSFTNQEDMLSKQNLRCFTLSLPGMSAWLYVKPKEVFSKQESWFF